MTDDELDRLVRDADPYRPEVVTRLTGAEQTLLADILTEPAPARFRPRHPRVWRTAAVLSAAAALIGVVAVPVLLTTHRPVNFLAPAAGSSASPSAKPISKPVELLKNKDKLLLAMGQPGWRITNVYGFAAADGTVVFAKGNLSLDLTYYQADYYDSYYQDRLDVSAPAPGTVDGWTGDIFTYSDSDWELMLHPRGGVFAGLRTTGPWTRAGFQAMLAAMNRVGVPAWLNTLPASTVTPPEVVPAATQLLTGVPLPPRFQLAGLSIAGVHDPYQFGTEVVGRVTCGWLDEWTYARQAGDDAAVERAAAALSSSHTWPVLKDMDTEGDYPEGIWELADRVAAGKSPGEYRLSLTCG